MKPVPALLLFVLVGCRSSAPATTVHDTTAMIAFAVAPTDTVLRLERTVCFGACPTYVVAVTAGGQTHFRGTGRATGFSRDLSLEPAVVSALLARFDSAGFFALDSAYTPGHPLCALYATDHPGAQLFARLGDRSRTVDHYHGCRGGKDARPEQDRAAPLVLLLSLEDAVDSLVGTGALVDSLRGSGSR